MAEGWIKLHRSITDSWLWSGERFTRGQAWIDLILLANYEDKKTPYKGELITCKRGVVNLSKTELAKRWTWNRKSVDRFLDLLESDGMVSVKVTTHRTTVTLINYDKFQIQGTTKGTTKAQQGGQQERTTKKEKNEKNILYKPTFGTFEKQNYDFDKIKEDLGIK